LNLPPWRLFGQRSSYVDVRPGWTHTLAVTAQLEVAAEKVARVAERILQGLPDGIRLTQAPDVLYTEGS
jgi:hypothetical protein